MSASLKNLDENADILMFDALLLPEIVDDAFSTRQVQKLPEYLKSLAGSLHKFYYDCRIIGTEDEAKLLKLLMLVALSLKTGLSLMGITAKDYMSKEQE
jgi:arginyl-tRNA synthetase